MSQKEITYINAPRPETLSANSARTAQGQANAPGKDALGVDLEKVGAFRGHDTQGAREGESMTFSERCRFKFTTRVLFMVARQKMSGRPHLTRVASKGNETIYRYPKFEIHAKTTLETQVEKEKP